jgi:mono/diheme cytochrome c family protein
MGLFNRYCIRCHGVDGRGVWDIPGVPDFTNAVWQGCRSDGQLVRIILEGRGAVMPPFRGTLSLEEAWAMARYLRTFLPGSETSRPDYGAGKKDGGATGKKDDDGAAQAPSPRKVEGAPKE